MKLSQDFETVRRGLSLSWQKDALSRIEEKLRFVERGWSITRTERDALKAALKDSYASETQLAQEVDALRAALEEVAYESHEPGIRHIARQALKELEEK